MKTRYLLSAAALLMAGSAQATVNVTSGALLTNGGTLAAGHQMLLNFENPNPEFSLLGGGDIVTGGNYLLTTGSTPNIAAAPTGNGTQYLAVLGTNGAGGPGQVTINFGLEARSFSLDVGSLDQYNSFQVFFLNANQTWTGGIMPNVGDFGNHGSNLSNKRFTWTGNAGERFTAVKLITSQNSLEVDNLSVLAVPEPATWALMLIGFGLVGAAARRRSVGPAAVAA